MMRPSADVADKSVSTEDRACDAGDLRDVRGVGGGKASLGTNTAEELVRLEAVLSALVESKVNAIKAAGKAKKAVSRPRSLSSGHQGKLQRLTSTSTASSSHQESLVQNPPLAQYCQPLHQHKKHHHHHHHHHHSHRNHHHKHKRQSDSALLSSGLLFPKKRYRTHHIKSHEPDGNETGGDLHTHCHDCKQIGQERNGIYSEDRKDGLRTKSATNLAETTFSDENETGSRFSLNERMVLGHGPSTSCQNSPYHAGYPNYSYNPGPCNNENMMMSAPCCPAAANSQSKILVSRGEVDHVSVTVELDLDEEEEDEEEQAARRRKRKRRRKQRMQNERSDQVHTKRQKRIDPEDLPKRARWTIIATACLLLLMSVLLVGVTLRMAPIIDEMVRKENEQLMKSFGDEDNVYNATLIASSTTLDPAAATNTST